MNLAHAKITAKINAYCLFKIPLLAFITPQVVELDAKRSVVRVRLDLRTRNHLNVMYFGALAMGAELSILVKALETIAESGKQIDFIFKDFQADFLRRADGHVHFACDDGVKITRLIQIAGDDAERHSQTFAGYAFVPSLSTQAVMKYQLTLSVRQRIKPRAT